MFSSSEFLIDHAYKSVWCAPPQDRQHIVAPRRTTTRRGTLGGLKIGMHYYNLPTQSHFYHVFTIGDVPPILVGMDTIVDKWVNVRGHCIATSLLIDLYTDSGLHFPRHLAYFLYTRTGSLVIAFKHSSQLVNLGDVQPFIRWRSNAYFDGTNDIPMNQGIEVEGKTLTGNPDELYAFQHMWRTAQAKPGYAYAFCNGKRIKDINPTTVGQGDIVEYVYDASVKEVIEVKVKDLLDFDSILDLKNKFLIARAGLGATIDYLDDLDFWLLRYSQTSVYDGVYYHQNQVDAVRMVTHRDYALPSAYVRGYVMDQPAWTLEDDLRVEVVIRHSGFNRPLANEHHRIKELFKLPEAQRLDAMIGEHASVSVWQAASLENSDYHRIMRASFGGVTMDLVKSAYGYNAVSKLIGDTPYKVSVSDQWIKVPFASYTESTAYEYNAAGRLIGWYIHDKSLEYPIRNDDTRYVEIYPGRGGIGLSTAYNAEDYALQDGVDYRFYVADVVNGQLQNNWRDVTGDEEYYSIVDDKVQWNIEVGNFVTAIRSNLDFLSYTLELDYRDDLLAFTVQTTEINAGLVPVVGPMDIPPGEVDVFLNFADLIEGIDYYVNWPEVCIVNKEHLVAGTKQRVDIRARGFCKPDLTREPPKDFGFISHRQLSRNAHFHIRDDRVTRVSIAGSLYTVDEVAFSEDGTLLDEVIPNGYPYRVTHPIIPMLGVVEQDTYAYRAVSEAVDKEIMDYLTLHLPESVPTLPNPIPATYRVFSPLCAKLIYDMLNGVLLIDEFKAEYSLDYLRERLRGYDWILPYDPAIRGVDEQYVTINPHPENVVIELNIYQYRLLDRAIKVMLNGKVSLPRHLVIVEEGYEYELPPHDH